VRRLLPARWRDARISQLLPTLDSWHFWITVAFLVVGGLVVVSILNRSGLGRERAAREQAGIARVEQCLRARTVLYPRLNRYFAGTAVIAHVLVINSVAAHQATPPGTKIYRTQSKNLTRLRRAVRDVEKFRLPVPTVADCEKLRKGG
jgi:hypothetical protein